MHHSIGLADGYVRRLKPRPTTLHNQFRGYYAVTLGPLLPGKASALVPQELDLALLVSPPTPEGGQYIEMDAAGYQRQKVHLIPGGRSGFDVNPTMVAFGPTLMSWPIATHLAFIGSNGLALYSGRLVQLRAEAGDEAMIYFRPQDLRLKRS